MIADEAMDSANDEQLSIGVRYLDKGDQKRSSDKTSRYFSNSTKRHLSLEKWIHGTLLEEGKRKKLKKMCRTRWVERHEAFEIFSDLFLPVVCSLEDISHSVRWNRYSRSDAQTLHLAFSLFNVTQTLRV